MELLEQLFNRLDEWRHLPSYQLERRADIFFAIHMQRVLERKLGLPLRPELIPEFPVHIRTIYPRIASDKSFKIDYLALAEDGRRAFFIELKTDQGSRREKQDRYLQEARRVGLAALLRGLLTIFHATSQKRKYAHLLCLLEGVNLLALPAGFRRLVSAPGLQGISALAQKIDVTAGDAACEIIYVQPTGEGHDIINFRQFSDYLADHGDPLTCRFAASLKAWAALPAGHVCADSLRPSEA